jgi:hypothetical protein
VQSAVDIDGDGQLDVLTLDGFLWVRAEFARFK